MDIVDVMVSRICTAIIIGTEMGEDGGRLYDQTTDLGCAYFSRRTSHVFLDDPNNSKLHDVIQI